MNLSSQILSDIIVHMKYARYLQNKGRRETWKELVQRNANMHKKKYPQLAIEIQKVYDDYVLTKKVLPSMRSLQFGGRPIELSPNRLYNCAYMPVDHPYAFSEAMFLLLGGSGVGFSVQSQHIHKLPEVIGPNKRKRRFVVSDNIEGWAEAIKMLIKSYFNRTDSIIFDFSDIRPKGALLITSGGKAPGPQPLEECILHLRGILNNAIGRKLTSLEAHDMMCFIADAVLAGGIRRAAMISLFDLDDREMLACKSGAWYELNPQRGRANNSAVIVRHKITKEVWDKTWEIVTRTKSGEPGFYFTNDKDYGLNPCAEIALKPNQFC